MALGWLLTFRGIPQMYYGMEHLLTGFTNPDGLVRQDFIGGWKTDATNKFTTAGRTAKENDMFNYIKTLANFRKNSSAIKTGKFMQYTPDDGLYVYFRYDANQTIMCMMNTADTEKQIDFSKYYERTKGFSTAKNIVTAETLGNSFKLPSKRMMIMQLER